MSEVVWIRRLALIAAIILSITTRLKPDLLRLALAGIILAVALRMLLGLTWRPDEIFSVEYL